MRKLRKQIPELRQNKFESITKQPQADSFGPAKEMVMDYIPDNESIPLSQKDIEMLSRAAKALDNSTEKKQSVRESDINK